MRRYYVADLIKLTGLKRITIDKRLSSKYAKERWGVKEEKRYSGVYKYVPASKIHLWTEDRNYKGRPSLKFLKERNAKRKRS